MVTQSQSTQRADDGVTTFRASGSRARLLIVGGIILGGFSIFTALIPLIARPKEPPPIASVALVLGTALGLALTSAWLFLLASRVAGMRMEVTDEGLHLVGSLYEWYLWSPWAVRDVRLHWEDVLGIRLWPFPNELAPGGVQENIVLYTARGVFGLSNMVWPNLGEMADVIVAHTGLTVARAVRDLPPQVAAVAGPSRKERIGLGLMHGLGWLATVMGWLMLGITVLLLFAGGGWNDSMVGFIMSIVVLMAAGRTLRRFRLE